MNTYRVAWGCFGVWLIGLSIWLLWVDAPRAELAAAAFFSGGLIALFDVVTGHREGRWTK